MTISIRDQLVTLDLELPAPTSPAANYISVVRTGNLLFISGQISKAPAGEIIAGTWVRTYLTSRGCKRRVSQPLIFSDRSLPIQTARFRLSVAS